MTRPSPLICFVVSSLCVAAVPAAAQQPPLLGPLFQDHAVLQRDRPIPIWGDARPGERVTVSLGGRSVEAVAGPSGRWEATLPALVAGGPFSLVALSASGSRATADDVMVGDVWLCSGQSNMAWPVRLTLNAENEIRQATNGSIRVLTVGRAASPTPLERPPAPLTWQVASPDTVKDFSAACYYFARELRKTVPVPMGLINSSWGGANIEAWIGGSGLKAVGGFDEHLDLLELYAKDPAAATTRLGRAWEQWWRGRAPQGAQGEPWRSVDEEGWSDVPPAMTDWKTWGVKQLENLNGMVWFRRRFELTAAQAAQPAVLALGAIDELDQTWVNGEPAGNSFGWATPREYQLPAGRLREGPNLVVVNVFSAWDKGGMFGPADAMALRLQDGTVVPLGGSWRYRAVPPAVGLPPRGPWHSIGGLTTLHNAMIAPLAPYGLRGVLWYQGESNADAPDRYRELLGGLMADWRRLFGQDLPLLVVQLPNFGPAPTAPVDNGWARVREAQRLAVAGDARSGLVVTIDIGDRQELHPPNKQEVGRRLAHAARHVVYGETISPSGPVPLSVRRYGSRVVVGFRGVEGKLLAYSSNQPIGFEVCGADQASCRFVSAAIQGNTAQLDVGSAAAPPTRVRYCWGAGPVCTLYDESGLPAGPFELEVEAPPTLDKVDYHVHVKSDLTLDEALRRSAESGIAYGIAINGGASFPISSDAGLEPFLRETEGRAAYVAFQAEGREWVRLFTRPMLERFDYVFTDAMTWTDDSGKRMRLWMKDEVGPIADPQAFMEVLVKRATTIFRDEPIDLYVNPTFLPEAIRADYDRLWTPARMQAIVDGLAANGIAMEINNRYRIPSAAFIRLAKQAGVKFACGTNNAGAADLGRNEYCSEMIRECGLAPSDFWNPPAEGRKAIQRKPLLP
jgi:sialate O-acetylesterase